MTVSNITFFMPDDRIEQYTVGQDDCRAIIIVNDVVIKMWNSVTLREYELIFARIPFKATKE